jgi:hypothetical protein
VRGGLDDVCGGRDHSSGCCNRGPEAKSNGDRHEEEGKSRVRERSARKHGKCADHRDVHRRRSERKARARRSNVDPGEHASAPRGERGQGDDEAGALRIRMLEPLADREQDDRRQPQPRDDALGLGGPVARRDAC